MMNKWLLTAGLIGSAGQALAADTVAPVVTPSVASGAYSSAQKFTLSVKDSVDTAPKVYFTKDGTLPTTESALYKSGLTIKVVDKGVSRDLFLRTLAVDASGNIRRQSFNYYIDSAPVVTPSLAAGSYKGDKSITLSVKDETDTAPVVYYTIDGTLPGKSSPVYTAGTAIKGTASSKSLDLRIRTLAMDSDGNYRRQIFDYKLDPDTTAPVVTASVAAGTYSSAQSVKLTVTDDTDAAPKLYYTTDGTTPTSSSTAYTAGAAIAISKSATLQVLAVDATGNSKVYSYAYVIKSADTTAPVVTASVAAGTYAAAQSVTLTVSDDTDSAPALYYTTDGTTPTTSSTKYTTAIAISASATLKVLAVDASANSKVYSYAYVINADTWYFRGTPNSWATTLMNQEGTLYCTTQTFGAASTNPRFKVDHYGDWKENYPTADYTVTADTTYKICFNPTSKAFTVVKSSTGTTDTTAPVATASVAAGTYTSAQSVTLTVTDDVDTAPALYYTIDGTTPTTSSTRYSSAIAINATTTLKVLAVDATGNSQVYSFAYTINSGTTTTDSWYFRGTSNNWVATAMTAEGSLFCTTQTFGASSTSPRFKIDNYANWTESYPTADYTVSADSTYKICFNPTSKAITATKQAGADTTGPVISATPSAGSYSTTQYIGLSATDDQDSSPVLYYTTDGTEPTTSSTKYTNQTITASDKVTSGADLTIKTLAVDATGNKTTNTFTYYIGDTSSTTSGDFRSESIYFVMTARFYDGDSSNNYYNRDRYKAGDPQWRGDFKGLISQLDYIKDLGFTAIWVTPPVENRSGLDYHGYHAYDWTKVDPRLESVDATYQDFINAAHAKGLKVIQDVVVNHSSQYGIRDQVWIDHLPIKYYVPTGSTQGKIVNGPYLGNLGDYKTTNRDDNDNSVAPAWFQARHNSDPDGTTPLVDPNTGTSVPLAGYNANRFFGFDASTLDKTWYHQQGFMAGGDWENATSLYNKHMAGDCVDLNTGNATVRTYLNNAIHKYLDMGVDAIRLDTAKHVERSELLTYTQDWQAYKPGLFIFGEVLVKGAGFGSEITNDNASAIIRPWWYTRTGSSASTPSGDSGLSVLDFPLFSTFRDNVTKGSLGGIKSIFDYDYLYADPTKLVTFFQNHDVGPDNDFKYRFGGEKANAALAYNVLWTVRGIPSLYYGEEVMFQAGLPEDLAGSSDTLDQTGRAYFGDKLDNKATLQADTLYQHIKRLNQIRKAIPALQTGTMSNVSNSDSYLSFVRSSSSSYVVVGLANGSSQTLTVSSVKNGTYTDAVTGNTIKVTNGSLTFTVKPYSIGTYVLDGPGKVGSDGNWLK